MANVDFPEPDSPVKTTSLFLGISNEISFKFPSLALLIIMLFNLLNPLVILMGYIYVRLNLLT